MMITGSSIVRRLSAGLSLLGLGYVLLLSIAAIGRAGDDRESGAEGQFWSSVLESTFALSAGAVVLMVLAARWLVASALKPIVTVARAIDEAPDARNGFRIDANTLPAEIAPFARSVNGLLSRLEQSADQREAFAADVAHELRTPLAILALELGQLQTPDAPRLHDDVLRLCRLIDQLMLMAQLDPLSETIGPAQDVALEAVAADVVSQLAPRSLAQQRDLALTIVESITVTGQPEMLAAAMRNLVENAIRVTPIGQTITILIGPGQRVRVRDGGCGLSPSALARLSKRYRRGDHASDGGAGLGLAIASRIAALHEAHLETAPEVRELIIVFPETGIAPTYERAP